MSNWTIRTEKYEKKRIAENGNRFLIGNGYMGIRGTLEEHTKAYLPAVNLAGIYDKVGDKWREPLNAPNGFKTWVCVDGQCFGLPETEPSEHVQTLDFRRAVHSRETIWRTPKGKITIQSLRFCSMENLHLLAMEWCVWADFEASVDIYSGIDADVWDINGPHYAKLDLNEMNGVLCATGYTGEGQAVSTAEGICLQFEAYSDVLISEQEIVRKISFSAEPNRKYTIQKTAAVYTSKDTADYRKKAISEVKAALECSFEESLAAHEKAWEKIWASSTVTIQGDEKAEHAVNYSLYHLNSIAPRHADNLSVSARGLSGQTYKGAVFWDTELFVLDFFLNTNPKVARSLVQYRIETLPGALNKAREYGCDGAFYAWESQEGGFDACTDFNVVDVFTGRPMRTHFRDKQYHISAAVVYGIVEYYNRTGDMDILIGGGFNVIIECAKFYYSLIYKKLDDDAYSLLDVVGPDEYHERVNNNGYTNRMAKFTFESAVWALSVLSEQQMAQAEKDEADCLIGKFKAAADSIFIAQPDKNGIIEQFDGYMKLEDISVADLKKRLLDEKEYWGGAYGIASGTKIAKQADVVAWLSLFPNDFSKAVMKENYLYYMDRAEHGSSLSASMFAGVACRCGMPNSAYPLFMKSACEDLKGGGKQWAGLIYIGGTHPAAAGGAYQTLVYGFGGLHFDGETVTAKPNFPDNWERLRFRVWHQGKLYEVDETKQNATIKLLCV